jgi:hypothetical protein
MSLEGGGQVINMDSRDRSAERGMIKKVDWGRNAVDRDGQSIV